MRALISILTVRRDKIHGIDRIRCNVSIWMINNAMCATSILLRFKMEKGAEKHHSTRLTVTRQLTIPVRKERCGRQSESVGHPLVSCWLCGSGYARNRRSPKLIECTLVGERHQSDFS